MTKASVETLVEARGGHIGVDDAWPPGVSDGLTLGCADCGAVPRFDYTVADDFWALFVPDDPDRRGVICLPCLDKRCGGRGLATALRAIQWTGSGHTVELCPARMFTYDDRTVGRETPAEKEAA